MKDYQKLIGMILIALAIIVSGWMIAQAIESVGESIQHGLFQLGASIR